MTTRSRREKWEFSCSTGNVFRTECKTAVSQSQPYSSSTELLPVSFRYSRITLHCAVCLLRFWQHTVISFNLTSASDDGRGRSWPPNPGICSVSLCFGGLLHIQLNRTAPSSQSHAVRLQQGACLFQSWIWCLFQRAQKAIRPATLVHFAAVFNRFYCGFFILF